VRCGSGKASVRRANDGADLGADHLREVDHTPNKTSVLQAQEPAADPRLIFLERAAARLILFEAGLLDLDEAFQGLVASLAQRKRRRRA
jgi:hypothetical protein